MRPLFIRPWVSQSNKIWRSALKHNLIEPWAKSTKELCTGKVQARNELGLAEIILRPKNLGITLKTWTSICLDLPKLANWLQKDDFEMFGLAESAVGSPKSVDSYFERVTQCDQMPNCLFNIWSVTTIQIRPIAEKIVKYDQNFAKAAKFR